MCLRPARVRQLTRHHLIPQSWFASVMRASCGGDWFALWRLMNADANIVPLCRPCHDLVEVDREARVMLRRVLTVEELAFMIQVRGRVWVEHRYPRPATRSGAAIPAQP